MASVMVFTGNANPELTNQIARSLGISISNALVDLYSDGEINIEIKVNVRGNDVFIVQPICLPTNRNVMELVLMIDALRRASAGRITAVVPYFGYARQDRRVRSARVPISAKVVADMLSNAELIMFSPLICMQSKYRVSLTVLLIMYIARLS